MKQVPKKDLPEVSGGDITPDSCIPFPPLPPDDGVPYPENPFGPVYEPPSSIDV